VIEGQPSELLEQVVIETLWEAWGNWVELKAPSLHFCQEMYNEDKNKGEERDLGRESVLGNKRFQAKKYKG